MNQPAQQQPVPGSDQEMDPRPDYGYDSYRGSGRLAGKVALITGGDSGIGKAVALAYAREGADVAIGYLSEDDDALEAKRFVEDAGRRAVLLRGDVSDPAHCRDLVRETVEQLGSLDVLVSNAAFQMEHESVEDVPDDEWDYTWATNVDALFHLVKAALPHLKPGGSIIGSSSVNSDQPNPTLMPYAATKAAIASITASLAQMLAERGIRVNSVAPGPVWTPLIPSTLSPEKVEEFGGQSPIGRPAQPAELAPIYVTLASDEASYVSGARIAVTGGRPIL